MEIVKTLTISEAWNELKKIDNQISLYETLRVSKSKTAPKTVALKDIIISGGCSNNYALLNAFTAVDEYTENLHALYIQKNAYEKYILDEITRMKISSPGIVIGFLKDYQKMTWLQIEHEMKYSDKQCRRYYDEYKGKTPRNNSFCKDDQL